MYRRYPHDLNQQSRDTADRAVEGDRVHTKLVTGSVVIACTANVQATSAIVFPTPFTPASLPDVVACLSAIANAASNIKYLICASVTETGFTIKVLSDTTQSITVTYHALGITT